MAENGRPFAPTYRPPMRMPHTIGIVPVSTTLLRKSVSDGPHEPPRSRGSPLIAVNVVDVRARQQPNVVLSSALLYVYEPLSSRSCGNAAVPSRIAARSRPSPVFVNSRTRPSGGDASAFVLRVRPCASIVVAGTNTGRSSSFDNVNAGSARRLRSTYI